LLHITNLHIVQNRSRPYRS